MHFGFGLKSSTLLIFFVHGIIFTLLLLYKGFRNEEKSSFWLTAFIGLLLIRALFFIINPEWANFGRKYWYYLAKADEEENKKPILCLISFIFLSKIIIWQELISN